MTEKTKQKVVLSNKVHPFFSGLSDDLMFWAAINTMFLTTVKNLNASQISALSAIAIFSSIILQGFIFKIIKKIGNINSVRTGLFLLLMAAIIITFFKNFFFLAIGQIVYQLAFFFTGMGSVILKNNLCAVNRTSDFSKMQSKSSLIYAILTMITAFTAGFFFNINEYLPMILCIGICIFNIFLSFVIYEYKDDNNKNQNTKQTLASIDWSRIIILIIITYGLLYATVETLQENGKIFMQYNLQNFVANNKVSVYLTFIIALSRISRVLANLFFNRIYLKLKEKFIILLNSLIIVSVFLMILGYFTKQTFGIGIMATGFCILLFTRDPIMIFTKTELLEHCDIDQQEEVMHKYNLSRKIIRFCFATLVALLLSKIEISIIMIFILIMSGVSLFPTFTMYKELRCKNVCYNIN